MVKQTMFDRRKDKLGLFAVEWLMDTDGDLSKIDLNLLPDVLMQCFDQAIEIERNDLMAEQNRQLERIANVLADCESGGYLGVQVWDKDA